MFFDTKKESADASSWASQSEKWGWVGEEEKEGEEEEGLSVP